MNKKYIKTMTRTSNYKPNIKRARDGESLVRLTYSENHL